MTLERQILSVPIGVSMSQAEAAPYVQGNAEAVNVRFEKTGLVSKRRPAAYLTDASDTALSNNVTDVSGVLHVNGIGGSMRFDAQRQLFTRQNRTEPRTSQSRVTAALRGRRIAANPSIAVIDNIACVVWTDDQSPFVVGLTGYSYSISTAEVWCAFYDISGETFRLLSGPSKVTGYVRSAHVVAVNTGTSSKCFILIGESSSTAMRWDRYVLSAGTYTFSGGAAFAIGRASANAPYDACGVESAPGYTGTHRAYAVWPSAGGTQVYSVTAAGVVTGTTVSGSGRTEGIACGHNQYTNILYIAQRNGIYWGLADTLTGALAGASGTLSIPASMNVLRVAVCGSAASGSPAFIAFSGRRLPSVGATARQWGVLAFKVGGVTASTYVPNVAIIGKPLFYSSAQAPRLLLPVQGFESRRGFLLSFDGLTQDDGSDSWPSAPHAAFSSTLFCEANTLNLSEDGLNAPISNWTTPLVLDSDGDIHFVYPVALELDISNPIPPRARILQLDHARVRAAQHAPCRTTRASDLTIHASGSGAVCADTQFTTELTPQRPDAPKSTGRDGDAVFSGIVSSNTDTYYLSVIWGWIDMQGREHRSAESGQWSGQWTGGLGRIAGSDWIPFLFVCPIPMPLALYQNDVRNYYVDIIQSAANDADTRRVISRMWNPHIPSDYPDCAVFQLVQNGLATSALYPRSVATAVRDFTATTIAFPEPYTTSELEASAPAGLVDIVSTQSRLWALSSEAKFSVLCTKPITPTYAPEFADELSVDIPQEGGDCIGLAALDDKLIVFKTSRIYIIVGDPGDASGNRSSVQRPRLLSSDVGATNAAGIVEGPFGVAFQSLRGPMLLTRGLELEPIGEKVIDLATGYKAVGTLVPGEQEVRWHLFTDVDFNRWVPIDRAVTWQYERNEWATWTDVTTLASVVSGDIVSEVWPPNFLRQETPNPSWPSATYANSITTPWVRLDSVEGYVRVWRCAILGYHYTGNVFVNVSYDYDDTIAETHTFLEGVMSSIRATSGRAEFSIRPNRQKCSSIRLNIVCNSISGQEPPYPTTGQGLSLVSVDLEIGGKSGTSRRRLQAEAKR